MFAVNQQKEDTCTKCGNKFKAPSYTKNGADVWGLCPQCLSDEEVEK
jgi:hypothetical protein